MDRKGSLLIQIKFDQGGGKRRVVICGFAAKPPAPDQRPAALPCPPCVPLLARRTRQRWASDQHRKRLVARSGAPPWSG